MLCFIFIFQIYFNYSRWNYSAYCKNKAASYCICRIIKILKFYPTGLTYRKGVKSCISGHFKRYFMVWAGIWLYDNHIILITASHCSSSLLLPYFCTILLCLVLHLDKLFEFICLLPTFHLDNYIN